MSYDSLMLVNSAAIVFQWAMLYYWMRLFPSLGFFITFLFEVVADILPFMAMFFICIFMFGNAVYVLNMSRLDVRHDHPFEDGEDTSINPHTDAQIVTNSFGNRFIDAMLDQY